MNRKKLSLFMKLMAIALPLWLALPTPRPPEAFAQGALNAVTVGVFLQGLRDVIQQLESSAHSLIDQGNIALGQQQMLLAGILQQTLEKAGATYATALNTTFGQLSVTEQNTFSDLYDSINKIKDLEKGTATDVQAIVYQTQGAANELLDRLPFATRYPVFYGASVRDLTTGGVWEVVGIGFDAISSVKVIASCGEVNDLIVRPFGEAFPTIDLAHRYLS